MTVRNVGNMQLSLPSDREIAMTRVFNAPKKLVYEAFTKPELLTQWLGVHNGWRMTVCEIDLRVGGKWHFVNKHPGGEAEFYGEYREISRPDRIVFTEIFADFPDSVSVVTSVLTEENGKTRMTATVRYPSKEVRDIVIGTGMATGAGISYDRLEDLLATLQ